MKLESGDISARYLDGVSSLSQPIKLEMAVQALIITPAGKLSILWPYAKIFVKEDWNPETGAIIGFKDNVDAGLAIYNHHHFLIIQNKLAARHKSSFILPTRFRHLSLMAIGACLVGILFLPLLTNISSAITFFVPYSVEKKLGNVILMHMADTFTPCDDKIALASLQKITDRLYQPLNNKDIQPRLHLFSSDTSNAFSLPGGNIAILTKFLAEAQSESEIAGVLAHEMGHMIKRDSLKVFVESQGIGLIAGLIGSSGSYGGFAEFAGFVQQMNYSRQKEFAADKFATDLLTQSGYSSKGLSAFLNRMDRQDSSVNKTAKYIEFLSTHPDTQERIRRIEKSSYLEKNYPSLTPTEFQNLRNACSLKSRNK